MYFKKTIDYYRPSSLGSWHLASGISQGNKIEVDFIQDNGKAPLHFK